MCYEGNVDLSSESDFGKRHALEVQIMEFGQIPKQLFTVPHPSRLQLSPQPSLSEPDSPKRGTSDNVSHQCILNPNLYPIQNCVHFRLIYQSLWCKRDSCNERTETLCLVCI